ncbi:PE-PPE domain-containing protein [Mycolicibacterium sp.]|uniref:PE-PPE domain-containing protein n=1 Tax=Mycolicibacterium sp. TaxID=2320850 RepID=UPI0028A6C817|nr:PE-PPE domain-containing protein [Mycolicibacterium sp.]
MALGLAVAPGASAATTINVNWDPAYTAGALAGLLNFVGNAVPGLSVGGGLYNSGPPQNLFASVDAGNIPLLGQTTLNLTLLLKYLSDSSVNNLYNTLAGIPQRGCSASYATNCRYALELATSQATLNLAEAYRTQIQSVTTGTTPAGFIPFEAAPNSTSVKPTQTNQALGFVQNPLRPNGGFYSRFPDWAEAFGINPEMPAAGKYTSKDVDGGKIALNTSTLDITWAYDPTSDLPEVFNLLAFANSLSAALPINLVTGSQTDLVITDAAGTPVTTTSLGLNVAAVLQLGPLPLIGALPMTDGLAYYITLVSDQLPLLTPVRLPGLAINAALNALNSPYLLGNPFADAIEPALKILVNIAYPDVLSPEKLTQCATGCDLGGTPQTWAELGYTPYQRTFLRSGVNIPFNSVEPLTPDEKKAVPGDVWNAFKAGVDEQLDKPFWGILVPNPDNPPTEVTPPAAVQPAAAAPAVEAEPIAAPIVDPIADDVAPPADPAPAVQVSAPADDPAPAATGRGGSRHGRGSADSGDSGSGSGGRHRAAD